MKFPVLILSACAALLVACGEKKKAPPVVVRPVVVEPVQPVVQVHPAGIAFSDAERQRKFELLFERYRALFAPPRSGAAVWLRLSDGVLLGGRVAEVEAEAVLLSVDGRERRLARGEIAAESRGKFFADDFARAMARRVMEEGPLERRWAEGTNSVLRYAMEDRLVARAGPGAEFAVVEGDHSERGQALAVLADFNGWLRIQDLDGRERWISQFLTYALDDAADPMLKSAVERLVQSGLITGINAETCEVTVELAMWSGTDSLLRQGIARTLATYCAASSGATARFVTIRDGASQRRLGKYSQSQGWKDSLL